MKTAFKLIREFPVSEQTLYDAWIDSEIHSAMTGGEAHCSKQEGEAFSAWDGYIEGVNLRLKPHQQIIQKWRTADFEDEDPDSTLQLDFTPTSSGCAITLTHYDIPEGQPDYEQGWIDNYFEPMETYFA